MGIPGMSDRPHTCTIAGFGAINIRSTVLCSAARTSTSHTTAVGDGTGSWIASTASRCGALTLGIASTGNFADGHGSPAKNWNTHSSLLQLPLDLTCTSASTIDWLALSCTGSKSWPRPVYSMAAPWSSTRAHHWLALPGWYSIRAELGVPSALIGMACRAPLLLDDPARTPG